MRLFVCLAAVCAVSSSTLRAAPAAQPRAAAARTARVFDEKRIPLPLIGTAIAYVPRAPTPHVILIVSGTSGWDKAASRLATRLAPQAVVIGISYGSVARRARTVSGCWYIAADFELLSHAAQKTLNLPQYHPPVLIGFGPGAAVVYSAVAGGPATTFAGLITFDFCPVVRLAPQVCAGDEWTPDYDYTRHVTSLPPTKLLPRDWWVLQPAEGAACPVDEIRRFTAQIPLARVADPGSIDRAIQTVWAEKAVKPPTAQPRSETTRELEDEFQKLDLPLEFRWPAAGRLTDLLLFFSGDGGWASLDESVSEYLVARGVGVVGVSSLRYFWKAKPPSEVAADIARLAAIASRGGRPVFAGGFSFGAEIVPVSLAAAAPASRAPLAGVIMIAPGLSASFEIDPLDWIRTPPVDPATRVAPAARALGIPALCVAGESEEDTPCPALASAPRMQVVRLPGSHHFNSDYTAVGEAVSQFIRSAAAEPRP